MAGNIVPRTDGGSNLGTPVKEFDTIYAKNLGGTLARKIVTTASPALTGIPTAPTAAQGVDTDQLATTKFVNEAASTAKTEAITAAEAYADEVAATAEANAKAYTDTEKANYLPLSGGTISGAITKSTNGEVINNLNNDQWMRFKIGETVPKGATLDMYGSANDSNISYGRVVLVVGDGNTSYKRLVVGGNGSLAWNDTGRDVEIKSMAFPSSTKVSLTTSGSSAVAPANGLMLFYFNVVDKSKIAFIRFYNARTNIYSITALPQYTAETTTGLFVHMQAEKGDTCACDLLQNIVIRDISFVYAEGEV